MKKRTILLNILMLFLVFNASAQDISEKQHEHVNKFISAVSEHNQKLVIKCMNKAHRKEQIKFLGGNKQQFVDELFGGTDIVTPEIYFNIKLNEVERIEVAEVIPLKGDAGYNYIFRVRSGKKDILSSLRLVKKGRKYGFIGAVG